MHHTNSRQMLIDLKKHLSDIEASTPHTKEKSENLTFAIDNAMEQKFLNEEYQQELLKHLKDSALHFEVSHPTLTALINNIINTLNQIGI